MCRSPFKPLSNTLNPILPFNSISIPCAVSLKRARPMRQRACLPMQCYSSLQQCFHPDHDTVLRIGVLLGSGSNIY
jgi:hypothetical protein